MEELYATDRIRRRDLESVYEGLFLRAMNALESFLEGLFIEVMLGNARFPGNRVAVRVAIASRGTLWEVLLQGDDYLDWLPYGRTEERAKTFLKNGRPFTVPSDGDRSKLKQCMVVRNAIAHTSPFSSEQFEKKVIANLNLSSRERTPAGYLRSVARTSPTFVRFQICASDLADIASRIAECRQ
jgi:hypothetical protein